MNETHRPAKLLALFAYAMFLWSRYRELIDLANRVGHPQAALG
jgi:hypothetical protein